jgi:hypothetical protein
VNRLDLTEVGAQSHLPHEGRYPELSSVRPRKQLELKSFQLKRGLIAMNLHSSKLFFSWAVTYPYQFNMLKMQEGKWTHRKLTGAHEIKQLP